MEIRQMKCFIQVCNDKSVSKAAENMHISQQGLSKIIKNLEDEFKISLFDRSSKGVEPTEFGNLLLEKSQEFIKEFDLMVDFLYDKAKVQKGKIYIGVPYILYTKFLATIIFEFNEKYPDIELEVVESGSYKCEKKIEEDLLDISFAVKPVNNDKCKFIPVATCGVMLLVNKERSLAKKGAVKFKELKNEKIIMLSAEYKIRQLIIECCLRTGFKPNIVFTASQLEYIIELVALNKGIAILPELNVLKAAKNNDKVSVVSFKDNPFKIEMGLITNKFQSSNKIINMFINYTLDFFENKGLN